MTPEAVKGFLELGFAGGAFSLVVWVVQRTFKHTIPRLAEGFQTALQQQQAAFRDDLRETREAFREELRLERVQLQELLSSERQCRVQIGERIEHLIALVLRMEDKLG